VLLSSASHTTSQNKHKGIESGQRDSVLKELLTEIDSHRSNLRLTTSTTPPTTAATIGIKHNTSHNNTQNKHKTEIDEINYVSRHVYHTTNSVSEEIDHIYSEVRVFLTFYSHNMNVPWKVSGSDFAKQTARVKSIQNNFGIDLSGHHIPLTLLQWVMYGTVRRRLESKLEYSRKRVCEIENILEQLPDTANQDIALIQFFVLEQFNAFKRFALRYQFFYFPTACAEKINPIIWICGWLFLFGSLLFFSYWVLAWGIQNGNSSFRSWGVNYALQFAEDVFVIQIIKIYVMHVLAMYSIRPQLNYIYRTLTKLAINYAQDGAMNVMCDIRVIQYMSPACRAARLSTACDLASSKILRQVDDIDKEVCQLDRTRQLLLLVALVLGIPAAIGMFSLLLGDMVMNLLLPSAVCSFILFNAVLYKISVFLIIALYGVVLGFYLWRRRTDKNKESRRIFEQKTKLTTPSLTRQRTIAKRTQTKHNTIQTHVTHIMKSMYVRFNKYIWQPLHTPYMWYIQHNTKQNKINTMWQNMNIHSTSCNEAVTAVETLRVCGCGMCAASQHGI